ncbi:GST N-terminal domain-containing protein [Trichoderma simmonsii]|uniref:GST N-terminal domain-containing protein n=1 Tax=Trichoderma simmonsii TaxID=1491479 RepID=A0A8G0LDD2_9HYPO|nr:GST N-terminal domain-containing protein [Trichoderma simmonsii]
MTYTLHIANKRYSSWSMRPWVLFKALDIPFEEKLHFLREDLAEQRRDYLTFSPSAKVPTLVDNSNTTLVHDSLAIAEYLAEDFPAVWPSDKLARAFARCAAAEMHSGFATIRNECTMNVALRIELGTPSEALQRDIDRLTEIFNEGISKFGGPWIAGKEFSAADAFYAPIASRCKTFGIQLAGPAGEYIDRLYEHPAVQAWVEEGIVEAGILARYEADCTQGRKVLKNLGEQQILDFLGL